MMNPAGGRTGKAMDKLQGDEEDFKHPVIQKARNRMEEYLMRDYEQQRKEYVGMVGSIKGINKVDTKKREEGLSVPADGHVMVRNRGRPKKEGFLSSDEETFSEEDEEETIPTSLNQMSHVEVIERK